MASASSAASHHASNPACPSRSASDVTALPHGHDAWVVGDEPVVVDWWGASSYAK
jgi:hypothetical protein